MQKTQLNNERLRPYEPILMTFLRVWDAIFGVVFLLALSSLFHMFIPYAREVSFIIFFLTMICFHSIGLYHSWRFSSFRYEISQIFLGCFTLYAILILLGYIFEISILFPRIIAVSWMLMWPISMAAGRIGIRTILRYYRKKGHNLRRAIIVGGGNIGEQLAHAINENPWSGTQLIGFFDDEDKEQVAGYPVLGELNALPDYVKQQRIDIVYLALDPQIESRIHFLLHKLADSTVSVYFIPDIFLSELIAGGSITYFDNLPVITLRDTPIRGISALVKRLEDLILSYLILFLAGPVFLVIAVGIKLTCRGSIFFTQWRYGLDGKPIKIYKFRTMNVEEDGFDFTQVKKDDPRVTRFGSLLRRTSLDELPQFINVIQGRMSLVGPRPHPVAMNEQYRKLVPGYMLRHKVKPGITGLAQVNGFRGETETLDKIEKRVKYDLEYLRQWSLLLDIKILLQTLLNHAWRINAY